MRQLTWAMALCCCILLSCTSQKSATSGSDSRAIIIKPNKNATPAPEAAREDDWIGAETEILWDKWGVPHIYAINNKELFYAFGRAQMHSHANTILKLYGTSRGRAAEYWGEGNMQSDMMVHTLGFPKLAQQWYDQQSDEFKTYIVAFAKGMNDYATEHPEAINEKLNIVLPVQKEDIIKHALFVLYSRFVGGNDLQKASRLAERGSNTYAIGPSKSASGNAMLVMNPHLPWNNEWLFYEGHFNAPGIHTYGATLVGLPTLGIAFNDKLGWSHTNNTIDNSDIYEIELKDNGYLVDGEVRPLFKERMAIKVKNNEGKIVIKDLLRYVSPDHGPILKRDGNKAYTIKMPGFDRPFGMVQWWEMSKANNIEEFKAALKEVQIPFFNIMYADVAGNIFYMFNGQVPKRKTGDWAFWQDVIDGSKSEHLWTEVHTYEELPKVTNPASGYLQNANDPPWSSTFPMELKPENFPPYMSPKSFSFRPQRAVRMMEEDDSITFDELVAYKHSTRVEMADRLLDDLNAAVGVYGDEVSRRAMKVLNRWDRMADGDSKGMALFYAWAHTLGPWNDQIYKKQWTLGDPVLTTPDGLANPRSAVKALNGVVQQFEAAGVPLDIPWGVVYRLKYGKHDLPGNGADGSVGMFRVAWSNGLEDDGKYYVAGGDSWQGIIEFGDKIRAKVLMSYGNSTQESSPNYGDQLNLFSKKEMRECHFYKEDVLQHVVTREVIKMSDN